MDKEEYLDGQTDMNNNNCDNNNLECMLGKRSHPNANEKVDHTKKRKVSKSKSTSRLST